LTEARAVDAYKSDLEDEQLGSDSDYSPIFLPIPAPRPEYRSPAYPKDK